MIRWTMACSSLMLVCNALPAGAETMRNDDVVKLSRSLEASVVVALIEAAEQFEFDTSTDAVIGLSRSGVPANVVAAMVRKSSSAGSSPTFEDGLPINDDVAYLLDSTGRKELLQSRLDLRVKSGGFGRRMLGDRSRTPMHQFEGPRASTRSADRQPTILICIRPPSTKPESVLDLVKCEANKQRRTITLLERTFSGANTGVGTKKSRITCGAEGRLARDARGQEMRIVRFTPKTPLEPGEYALVFSDSIFYDFGID